MPPRYFLRCLGSPELRGPTGEPIRIRTRKHLALLIYLAVEPRQHHRRDRLADLLWPSASLAEARHSLATALSMIRGKLGPRSYESTRDTVKLITPELELDLDRLLRGDVLGDEYTPPLDMGGFLDDFEVPTAPEFMHWRDQRRAQLFPTIRNGFVTLMDRRRRTGAFAMIEPLADRLLELDPLSEEAIRAKMEGRAFAGDRISALRIYQDWKGRLHSELGASPSALVDGMALRLRQRGLEAPGTAHVPTVQTDQWRDRAFIGRAEQYQSLYEGWEETKAGRGRHALVLGDSGIGKTTLLERFVTAAGLEGGVSVRVQCYESDREIPYSAINALVRGLVEKPGASATPPEWLAELAQTVPSISDFYPSLPSPLRSEGEIARLRLSEAALHLVTAVADENPLILVVDDLHLADDVSVAVLHLLMRRTFVHRAMFVLAAQRTGMATRPHASRLLESQRDLPIALIDVPLLTKEEMEVVLRSLSRRMEAQPTLAVAHALMRAAAGNPMAMELLFDDWTRHGEQCLALSVQAMTEHLDEVPGADALFGQILDRVSHGLSDPARAVLRLAAILGDRMNDLSMYEFADLTLAQTLAGMAELTSRRIFRDGGRELEFRNELLRGQAYLNIPSTLRRALHGLIADRLTSARERGSAPSGLALAWHCYRAGRGASAIPYLIEGSEEAINRGAPFEAELAIRSALPQLDGVNRFRARLLLAMALQEQGRWSDSIEVTVRDEVWPDEMSQELVACEIQARAAMSQDPDTSLQLLMEIGDRLAQEPAIAQQLRYAEAASRLVYYLGDNEVSAQIVDRLTAIDLQELDPQERASLCTSLATLAWSCRQLRRFPYLREALKVSSDELRRMGVASSLQYCLENVRGCFEMSLGSYEEALKAFLSAVAFTEGIGDDQRRQNAAANIALCYGRLGRFQDQLRFSELALRIDRTAPWRRFQASYCLAWSHAMLGEHQRALATLGDGLRSPRSPRWLIQTCGLLTADIYELCGRSREAIEEASSTLSLVGPEMLSGSYPGTLARWLAICLLEGVAPTGALDALRNLHENVETLDTIDQAQVFAATMLVSNHGRLDSIESTRNVKERLHSVLKLLPEVTSIQLQRLGMRCD